MSVKKRFYPNLTTKNSPPKHGGDLLSARRKSISEEKKDWIDLSSAVNRHPWPVPDIPSFLWQELPDQIGLQNAAQSYYQRSNFVALAGTQQAIEMLPMVLFTHVYQQRNLTQAPIVLAPKIGYQEHKHCWEKWGYQIELYQNIEDVFVKDWNVLILIQPNNPLGELASRQQVKEMVELAKTRQGFVIVDEAFIDPIAEQSLLADTLWGKNIQADKLPVQISPWPDSLIVLRSVGKFFGLAGARVGFLFACNALCEKVSSMVGPWPINTPSLWLVEQALQDQVWQKEARNSLQVRCEYFAMRITPLVDALCNALGFSTSKWSSSHLFFTLFFPEENGDSEKLFTHLKEQGIYIRLGESWLRFAIPSEKELPQIEKVLQNLLSQLEIKMEKVVSQ